MAATVVTKLRLKFKDSSDDSFYMNINHADDEATPADVKALGQGIVTNKLLWERSPVSFEAADFITTETTPVTLPE